MPAGIDCEVGGVDSQVGEPEDNSQIYNSIIGSIYYLSFCLNQKKAFFINFRPRSCKDLNIDNKVAGFNF